ncbi:restriction endonuclease S subunit [Candidatus Scalindua japonica]|uniref:Restriction endonuclease S subunit n=1 Tax=Candidatus Scalindua japonica TaxID=1284222 RepID=A0A286U0A6_9BACT|nr:restriction endonuclease subunit S [Candidatus Scalindua japonica]GAX61579.1 restriction endonuclease S subunit [Candidatus Scalindua japonica]
MLRVEAACNQSLVAMKPVIDSVCLPEYLFWNLRGRYYRIRDITGQNQRRGLNMKIVSSLVFSLPPLAEQKRIVAKVDSLMALSDDLNRNIESKMECSSKLLDAVLNFISKGR